MFVSLTGIQELQDIKDRLREQMRRELNLGTKPAQLDGTRFRARHHRNPSGFRKALVKQSAHPPRPLRQPRGVHERVRRHLAAVDDDGRAIPRILRHHPRAAQDASHASRGPSSGW